MSGILRLPAILKLTGLCRTTIWRMVKAGTFPQPVQLGARAVGWRASDVEEWLESRPVAGKAGKAGEAEAKEAAG